MTKTVPTSVTQRKKHQHPNHDGKNHRTDKNNPCEKGHTGCNNGCIDLCLEQGVCPDCKEKTVVMFGRCKKCKIAVAILSSSNPNHAETIKKRICPKCGCQLNCNGYCKVCRWVVIVVPSSKEIICSNSSCSGKVEISSGICGKCQRKVVFLNRSNPAHVKIVSKKLCPDCGKSLKKNGYCTRCNRKFTVLYACMGWLELAKKYEPHKNAKSESHKDAPLCVHNKKFQPAAEQKSEGNQKKAVKLKV